MRGAGNHTRVAPECFRTSTRVVTSKVRQRTFPATRLSALENTKPPAKEPVACRKSRRFINPPRQPSPGELTLTYMVSCLSFTKSPFGSGSPMVDQRSGRDHDDAGACTSIHLEFRTHHNVSEKGDRVA